MYVSADAMVVVTPDRGEEKKRNALEMLAYSEPAKKAASKRPREDTSSSNSYSHPALTADPSAKRAMRSMRKTANDNRQLVLVRRIFKDVVKTILKVVLSSMFAFIAYR